MSIRYIELKEPVTPSGLMICSLAYAENAQEKGWASDVDVRFMGADNPWGGDFQSGGKSRLRECEDSTLVQKWVKKNSELAELIDKTSDGEPISSVEDKPSKGFLYTLAETAKATINLKTFEENVKNIAGKLLKDNGLIRESASLIREMEKESAGENNYGMADGTNIHFSNIPKGEKALA